MTERGKVWKEVGTIDFYDGVERIIEQLKNYVDKYGKTGVLIERVEYPSDNYNNGEYNAIKALLDETDEELNKRIANKRRWDKQIEAMELKKYEELKKKFG